MYRQLKFKITIKIIDLAIRRNVRQTLRGEGSMHAFILTTVKSFFWD